MQLNLNLANDPRTANARIYENLARVDQLPILDDRAEGEILGYGEDGLPE